MIVWQMYGLASRESLSKRQSRWVRDVDESVRSNPAQRAINQETSSNPIRDKHSIISFTSPGILNLMNDQGSFANTSNDSSFSLASSQNPMLRKDQDHPSNRSTYDTPGKINERLASVEALYELVSDLKRDNTELQRRYSKLEQECESFKNGLSASSDLSVRVDRIEQQQIPIRTSFDANDIITRVTRLENNNELSAIVTRVSSLEQSLSEVSRRSDESCRESTTVNIPVESIARTYTRPIDNSSEFSAPTDPDTNYVQRTSSSCSTGDSKNPEVFISKSREFVPYFIKEEYAGRDNKTTLNDMNMDMLVDIVGLFNEIPVIYPFGLAKDLPRFSQLTLDMVFIDADKSVNGTVYGVFNRGPDGVYTIKITELYSDGEASGIEKLTLPLTITCNTELILE